VDLKQRLLNYLCDEMLQVDGQWTVRTEDSCMWWPHDLAQQITIRPVTGDGGSDHGILLDVETDVLRGIPPDYPAVAEAVNRANSRNTLSVLAVGDDGVLRLRFSLRIFEDTYGWMSRWAAWLCACQAADALDVAADPGVIHRAATRASSEHPSNGLRADVDEILGVRDTLIAESRTLRGALREVELADGLTQLGDHPSEAVTILGVQTTTHPWFIPEHVGEGRWAGHGDLRTAATLTVDERYGPVLVVMTWPAYAISPDTSPTLACVANDLARGEWSSGTGLGTWLADAKRNGVAVRTVLPAAMCDAVKPGGLEATVTNVARYQAQQCTELTVVIRTMTPDHEGLDNWVAETFPAELADPGTFGRTFEQDEPSVDSASADQLGRRGTDRALPDGMVRSYVETLIEHLTSADKAVPDKDGDYPIRYGNARYYVRVVEDHEPVIQVFSVAIDDVTFSQALACDLNTMNTQIHFCRVFWVENQVLVEAEHLGLSLDEDDFRACTDAVATATDSFAGGLAEHHGGRLAFEEAKDPAYTPPQDERTGFYL
jgi:hypothetical protein